MWIIMLPIALSLSGSPAIILAIGFFVIMNIRDKYYGLVTYEILNNYGYLDSVQVTHNHKVRRDYFCPSYCDINHAHFAHINTYECNNGCKHYTYSLDKVLTLTNERNNKDWFKKSYCMDKLINRTI